MKHSVFRPLQLAIFAFLALLVVALVISAGFTFYEQRRLADAQQRLARVYRFERVQVLVARHVQAVSDDAPENDPQAEAVSGQIDELKGLCSSPSTPAQLERLRGHALEAIASHRPAPFDAIILFQEVVITEHTGVANLLGELNDRAATQLTLEMAAPLALLAVGVLLLPVARRRIIGPLNAFGRQLSRLAGGDFSPVPLEHVDPLMLPLHRNFNELIRRLAELEVAHEARTTSLQEEVRVATRTLLQQQRSLARVERLAAAGELASSVAHELRNPLAAIQMTLSNLRTELHDHPELAERVSLVLDEVTRLTRLLNQLLDSARHAPEPARSITLANLVEDMLALTRCHVAANVQIENRIDPSMVCRLPQDGLRQALLNLILNAAAAVADGGGRVTADASRQGPQLRIVVSDDGPGFPDEVLRAGIRPFMSMRERGTGLGLALVRRFVRDLGGDVVLTNLQPHGACVTLLLPAESDAA